MVTCQIRKVYLAKYVSSVLIVIIILSIHCKICNKNSMTLKYIIPGKIVSDTISADHCMKILISYFTGNFCNKITDLGENLCTGDSYFQRSLQDICTYIIMPSSNTM